MRLTKAWLVGAVAVLWSACGGASPGQDGAWGGEMDTLPSGAVVVTNPSMGTWPSGETWRMEEDLRLGTMEGEGPQVFGRVGDLEVDDEGRIYVLDSQASEIRVFDPDGGHHRTLGRPGEGPGEFENVVGIELAPNGFLWAMDPGSGRYSAFDTAGALVATHRRSIGFFRMDAPVGFDRDGFLYDVAMVHASDARDSREVLVRVEATAEVVDTIELPEYSTEMITIARADGTPVMSLPQPFSPVLVWRFDSRGALWHAVGERYELVQQGLSGDTMRVVRRNYTPVPVDPEERDSALDAIERRIASIGSGARVDGDPDVLDAKPPFETFHIDAEGYLWVERTRARGEPQQFDVFDPEGRFLGAVRPPVTVQTYPEPVITEEAFYAVAIDSLGVPYVVRLRIEGRT